MAKISKKTLDYGGKRRDFETHYHTGKGFFVKLPSEVESIARMEYRSSEEEAEKHAKQRIEKYVGACVNQKRMISIHQSEAPQTWISGMRVDVSQISFSYSIVFENTLPDGTKAIVDESGSRRYSSNSVLIPWTKEREQKCKDLSERIEEASQRLHEFLLSAQEFPELLDAGQILLPNSCRI